MWTPGAKPRRSRRISLTFRGSLLILLAAVTVSVPVAASYFVVARAKQNEYLATTEAFLATALSAHLDNMAHVSQPYADWVTRLEGRSEQLRWAAVLKPDGEGVEFHRRTAFPLERIHQQVDFDIDSPRIRPLLIGGLPSKRLRLICIPQRDDDTILAAIVDTGTRAAVPGSMFAFTVALICGGLAASFAWLHYGMILPLRKSTAALVRIQADAAELTLEQLPPEEFSELAASIRETKQELHEWKERANSLSETIDRRVETMTRSATRARDRAEKEAHTDVLSGLASRRTLDHEAPRMFAAHQLAGRELAVAMIDINDFKSYNDKFGHSAGDELIAFMGVLLRGSTRRGVDLAARFGGDEFVVVMPDTNLREAVKIMKRTAALFAQHVKTRPVINGPSIAAGVACLHEDRAGSASRLIELADRAMYQAKRIGQPVVAAADLQGVGPRG